MARANGPTSDDRHAAVARLTTPTVLELQLRGRVEAPALRAALRTLDSLRTAAPAARQLLIDGAELTGIERNAADALAAWLARDVAFARCACVSDSALVRMLFVAMLARTRYADATVFARRDEGLAALETVSR